jgi:hypothetical protein
MSTPYLPWSRPQGAPRINTHQIIVNTVAGQIAHPILPPSPYRIGRDGVPRIVPGTGGIVLNRRVGDLAVGLAGDHVEPGASIRNDDRGPAGGPGAANRALMMLACVGNEARVTSGPLGGARGVVTGKHGGINHVLVDFPPSVLARLRIGDRVQIVACGQGMALSDRPDVHAMNLSPLLLRRWGVRVTAGGGLAVPVTHLVPSVVMGSGLGRPEAVLGDCDIELADPATRVLFRLDRIRLGDLVAILGFDTHHGASHRQGVLTFGVVVHSDSRVAGHGPGVTPLLVGPVGRVRPVFRPDANLALLLGLRRQIARLPPPRGAEVARWRSFAPRRAAMPASLPTLVG